MVTVDETVDALSDVDGFSMLELRQAQSDWARRSVAERVAVLGNFRALLSAEAREVAALIDLPQRTGIAESLAAELIPLADACKFLERNAAGILRTRRPSAKDRPAWGRGLSVAIHREPVGVVLVIGTWNYPLFLTGVQTLQALAAGNAVLIKPGQGTRKLSDRFVGMLERSGLPAGIVRVLDETPEQAQRAINDGVDKVVFTGSAATGKKVLAQLAETATPAVMELSGSDAVFVTPSADLDRVVAGLAFGLRMNGSSTCIAPRRVFTSVDNFETLQNSLGRTLQGIPASPVHPQAGVLAARLVDEAIQLGATTVGVAWNGWEVDQPFPVVALDFQNVADAARTELLQADVFAPVVSLIPVQDMDEALRQDALCPYALGATVFGERSLADSLARRIDAGCVVVNDMIAPTADPRVPFGGRRSSGFGSTRGAEGLLELTQTKAIVTQGSRWLPHLVPPLEGLDDMLLGLMRLSHSNNWTAKLDALKSLSTSGRTWWNEYRQTRNANRKRD